ncbi:MAG: CMP/dCMP kinase [Actinomycetota bacterium]|nr:CMP/dCMP kinase [Actinomycetota bacterium]
MPASRPAEPTGPARDRLVVAIDGPSGSGKSTVSRRVALRLGLDYLDTGAMYRALTWWVLDQGVDPGDSESVARLARALPLERSGGPADPRVAVDGTDVTTAIRETRITELVSRIAMNLEVRAELVRRQREVAQAGHVVIEGRDITTVVAPDAPVRVLLTASEAARLARRALDVHGSDDPTAVAATRDQVVRRDADDSTVAAFTDAAEGVTVIDSSAQTVDETVDAVLALVAAVDMSGSRLS